MYLTDDLSNLSGGGEDVIPLPLPLVTAQMDGQMLESRSDMLAALVRTVGLTVVCA